MSSWFYVSCDLLGFGFVWTLGFGFLILGGWETRAFATVYLGCLLFVFIGMVGVLCGFCCC